MALSAPAPLENGTDADADQVQAWLDYILSQIVTLASAVAYPPYANEPVAPEIGQAYFDTTLGFPRVYGADGTWHGILLS